MLMVMASLEDRPQMRVEDFEVLSANLARLDDGIRLEFVGGKVSIKAMPDGIHGTIVAWLIERLLGRKPNLRIYPEQGLKIEKYRNGRARPDIVLAPKRAFIGQREWADTDTVVMAVEVRSHDRDSTRRDCVDKPDAYGATGIPVYLLIDRDRGKAIVFAEPDGGKYQYVEEYEFGQPIVLPEPMGLILDSEELREWAD